MSHFKPNLHYLCAVLFTALMAFTSLASAEDVRVKQANYPGTSGFTGGGIPGSFLSVLIKEVPASSSNSGRITGLPGAVIDARVVTDATGKLVLQCIPPQGNLSKCFMATGDNYLQNIYSFENSLNSTSNVLYKNCSSNSYTLDLRSSAVWDNEMVCPLAWARYFTNWRWNSASGLLFSTTPDGDVMCMSNDGSNCLWGDDNLSNIRTAKPLVCGAAHQRVWGSTGYNNNNHWCSQLKNVVNANPLVFTRLYP